MHKNIYLISILCLLTGFIFAYLFFGSISFHSHDEKKAQSNHSTISEDYLSVANPFSASDNNRLDVMENEMGLIKQQLQQIELALQDLSTSEQATSNRSRFTAINNNRFPSLLNQRLFNIDNLINGGIDPSLAEVIVRRKNNIELKRLELQDRATRENYLNTQQYYDELEDINRQDINLRDELGDQRYDEYLFNSKQNNRIRITSVMLESAAERAGILSGDIVLSYDNQRMFSWQELKAATAQGQLGEYVSISIDRNGEIYSFSVPRGPLGVQLGATRVTP